MSLLKDDGIRKMFEEKFIELVETGVPNLLDVSQMGF